MPTLNLAKTQRIEVRASSAAKSLRQEAARASHTSVSRFLLDASITAAHQARAERRHSALSNAQRDEFQQALDRPVQAKPCQQNLLSKPQVPG